jgi:hypothetical protein
MKCRKSRDEGENAVIMRNVFAAGTEMLAVLGHSGKDMRTLKRLPPFTSNPKRYLRESWKLTYWGGLVMYMGGRRWDGGEP